MPVVAELLVELLLQYVALLVQMVVMGHIILIHHTQLLSVDRMVQIQVMGLLILNI